LTPAGCTPDVRVSKIIGLRALLRPPVRRAQPNAGAGDRRQALIAQ
jgi:hypothetical protein